MGARMFSYRLSEPRSNETTRLPFVVDFSRAWMLRRMIDRTKAG